MKSNGLKLLLMLPLPVQLELINLGVNAEKELLRMLLVVVNVQNPSTLLEKAIDVKKVWNQSVLTGGMKKEMLVLLNLMLIFILIIVECV